MKRSYAKVQVHEKHECSSSHEKINTNAIAKKFKFNIHMVGLQYMHIHLTYEMYVYYCNVREN